MDVVKFLGRPQLRSIEMAEGCYHIDLLTEEARRALDREVGWIVGLYL